MFKQKLIICSVWMLSTIAIAAGTGAKPHKASNEKSAGQTAASMPAWAKDLIKGDEWKAKLQERAAAFAPEQKAAVEKVKADLAGLKTASDSSTLSTDLMAMVTVTKKPSQQQVDKLASHLKSALESAELEDEQHMQLAQDLELMLNRMSVPLNERISAGYDMRLLLKAGKASADNIKLITDDFKSMLPTPGTKGKSPAASKPAKSMKNAKAGAGKNAKSGKSGNVSKTSKAGKSGKSAKNAKAKPTAEPNAE